MALAAYAIALSAHQALKGATWAEDRVFLEPSEPLKIDAPTLVIYCAEADSPVESKDILGATAGVSLRIEILLPETVKLTPGVVPAPGEVAVTRSAAFVFGIINRQIDNALGGQSVWAELFRGFALRFQHFAQGADLYQVENGRKVLARVRQYVVETLREPDIGQPPGGLWSDLIAAMQGASPDLSLYADTLAAVIAGAALPEWLSFAGSTGLLLGDADAIGLAFNDPDGGIDLGPVDPPDLSVVEIEDRDRGEVSSTSDLANDA